MLERQPSGCPGAGPCGPAFSGLCGVVCGKDLSDLGGKPGRVSAFVPVSLIELLIYAAILSALAGLLLVIRRRFRLRRLAAIVVKFAIVLFVLFTLNCGINYQRRTFAERADFTLQKSNERYLSESQFPEGWSQKLWPHGGSAAGGEKEEDR